jgi:hypothetical protein
MLTGPNARRVNKALPVRERDAQCRLLAQIVDASRNGRSTPKADQAAMAILTPSRPPGISTRPTVASERVEGRRVRCAPLSPKRWLAPNGLRKTSETPGRPRAANLDRMLEALEAFGAPRQRKAPAVWTTIRRYLLCNLGLQDGDMPAQLGGDTQRFGKIPGGKG